MISNLFLDIMFLHYIYVEIWYKLLNTIFKIFEQYLTYNLVYRILGYGRVKKKKYWDMVLRVDRVAQTLILEAASICPYYKRTIAKLYTSI